MFKGKSMIFAYSSYDPAIVGAINKIASSDVHFQIYKGYDATLGK
jgi:hypothetical protein